MFMNTVIIFYCKVLLDVHELFFTYFLASKIIFLTYSLLQLMI